MIADPPETAKPEAPDAARATDYLTTFVPAGRLATFAIEPDGPTRGRTFTLPAERDRLEAWIAAGLNGANLYFTLNEPVEPERQTGRGGRVAAADVQAIRGLVLDLDPDKAAEQLPGGFQAERARLRGVVDLLQAHFVCEPAAVVDTGGGYQLTYLLPAPIPATSEIVARVVDQSRGLATAFGGDATHDVAHLFRIPHTRNLPNAAKRARGRTETVSTLIAMPMARAPLDALPFVAPPIAAPALTEAAATFDCDEALAYSGAPEDLPAPLQMKLATAAAGSQTLRRALNPDLAAEHFSDRSGRDFAIAAALREDGGFTRLEAACVIAAYSPGKAEERGAAYLSRTVQKAWERTKPAPTAADYFDASIAPNTDRPQGLVTIAGRIDPTTIPVRRWLINPRIPLGAVTVAVGEPAISKSTFGLRDALIVATGREDVIRGEAAGAPERLHRTGPVVVYNAEDSAREMQARLSAAQQAYGVFDADMRHPIHLWSGVSDDDTGHFGSEPPLKLMHRPEPKGRLQPTTGWHQLSSLVRDTGAVLVILDPLISLFEGAEENSTEDMDALMQLLTNGAATLGISILVVQHTAKKTRDHAGDMGAGRGAFSIVAKARSQFTLCELSVDDAEKWGVTGRDVFRLDVGKASYGRRDRLPMLFERRSVQVGNGRGELRTDPFATSAEEMLQIQGDTAPVLVFIGSGASAPDAKERKAARIEDRRSKTAEIVCKIADGADELLLAQAWATIAARLTDAGYSNAATRNTVTEKLKIDLSGEGVFTESDGQLVRVSLGQKGSGKTAPWVITLHRTSQKACLESLSKTDTGEERQD